MQMGATQGSFPVVCKSFKFRFIALSQIRKTYRVISSRAKRSREILALTGCEDLSTRLRLGRDDAILEVLNLSDKLEFVRSVTLLHLPIDKVGKWCYITHAISR